MAFTPETGVGLTTSNAYMTEAEYRAYHADRGTVVTAQLTAAVTAAIVRATDYVDKRFGRRFRGDKMSQQQALEWPRSDAYTDEDYLLTGVPVVLKRAIAEYALLSIQLGRDLAPVPAPDYGILDPVTGEVTNVSSGKITEKSEEVGPIKESTKYATGDQTGRPMVGTGNLSQSLPEYPQADLWLEELLDGYASRELTRG
jgi:hypothetical protein